MSLTFNMVGGGGSGAAGLPAIYAKYPAGSVCTCTNGKKTFTAKGSTGYWLFAGLSVGTWTVTAKNGTKTTSKTVSITTEHQNINVTLAFELWLYKSGDKCVAVTGGWESVGVQYTQNYASKAPNITNNTTYETVAFSDNTEWCSGVYKTKNKIDLTEYNTLELSGWSKLEETQYSGAYIAVLPNIGTYWSGHPKVKLRTDASGSNTLDVSNCNGEYFIAVCLHVPNKHAWAYFGGVRLY